MWHYGSVNNPRQACRRRTPLRRYGAIKGCGENVLVVLLHKKSAHEKIYCPEIFGAVKKKNGIVFQIAVHKFINLRPLWGRGP